MISYLTVEKCHVDMLSNKYEKAIADVMEHLYTNIPLSEDKTLKFTVADYFCLTDLTPGQLLSYIRKFKQKMDPNERRIICKFLGTNQSLDMEMTMDNFKGESLSYIVDGEEKKVTDEMWQHIMNEFEQHNIPKRRNVLYSVASRDAWGLELTNLSTTGVWLRVESATENHIENGQYLFSRVSAAEGMCSHSEGIQALAKDECSHADGKLTTAFSKYSNATGYITEAVGFAAHSEGSSTVAGGGQSHAEGYQTIASSNNSHAEGSKTIAGGSQSHAEGLETIAAHDNEHAEGKYNKSNQLLVPPEGFVDLGLSVKWASNNLGAIVSRHANDWYGVYYGWAEKNAKENYTEAGYDFGMQGNMTKYNATDHKEIVEAVDDVATVKLGTGFRIPSLAEIAELYDTEKITREWVMNYNGVSGLNGMIFVSKVPGFVGHYIFIPATGYIDGTTSTGAETTINFWTNTVDASNLDNAIHTVITTSGCTTGSCERHIGHTIRPVAATGSTKVNTIHSIGIGSSRTSRKNAVEVMDNGFVYVNGLGGYEGDNTESGTILTLQQVIKNLEARVAALEGN